METKRSGLLRAPLVHWLIALSLACGLPWVIRAWLGYKSAQSAQTATLAWDAGAARQIDPDLAGAADPAVATAQSILSDPVVARLAQSAPLPSSSSTTRIGEFRSRLQLRQSSAKLLQVRFLDASPEKAARTANAVAGALVAGTRPPANAPPPSAPPAVVPPAIATPPASALKTPVARPSSDADHALAHSLAQLQAELSSTQHTLDSLSAATRQRQEHSGESASYAEAKEQQLLTAEVGAALKTVADLRADPANGPPAQEPLRRVQDALFSVWPASRAGKGVSARFMGFNAAGVDAGRLREEESEFARVLEVVRREQQAIQRLQPAEAASPAPAPAAPSPAAPSPAAPSAGASSAPAPSPSSSTIAESEIPEAPAERPFRLLRPAGPPGRNPLWPALLAGLCCGTLYLGAAGWRYRRDEYDREADYTEEMAEDAHRMITPARPLRAPDFFGTPAAPPPPARPSAPAPPADPPPAAVILPPPTIETAHPSVEFQEEKTSEISYSGTPMTGDAMKRPLLEGVVEEKGEGDPWVDNIMKSLSETSIGRMFEKPAPQDPDGNPAEPAHPDRRAGWR
ncbi:MAG TPA: hypothetical protein VHU89_08650 [Acidobacteriaceae bacterium]|jgi:hypothetical protein|nr:hypothetical protein [Acidobacteriaceae bacterium]